MYNPFKFVLYVNKLNITRKYLFFMFILLLYILMLYNLNLIMIVHTLLMYKIFY